MRQSKVAGAYESKEKTKENLMNDFSMHYYTNHHSAGLITLYALQGRTSAFFTKRKITCIFLADILTYLVFKALSPIP